MSAGQDGRVALITGGAGGIGSAIARVLARDGLSVVIAGRDGRRTVELAVRIRADGGSALGVEMDVGNPVSVLAGVTMAEEKVGAVNVLVNVAGWDELMPFVETDEAFWQEILEINFKGGVRVAHALLPGMIERRWGRIVNISSDAGRVGSSLESAYAGSKGAIIAFTKTLARETARLGVTANVVSPGPTETNMLHDVVHAHTDAEKVLGRLAQRIPMKRLGRPEDVAAAVRFFASDHASYITGQTLSVSGGLTMV